MTSETRRNVVRYGVAIDLVILAAAVGLLVPTLAMPGLLGVFAAAILLSAWKGGRQGAVTATVASIVALAAGFSVPPSALAALAGLGIFVSVLSGNKKRAPEPSLFERPVEQDAAPPVELESEAEQASGPLAPPRGERGRGEGTLDESSESEAGSVLLTPAPVPLIDHAAIDHEVEQRVASEEQRVAREFERRVAGEVEQRVAREVEQRAPREVEQRVAAERAQLEQSFAQKLDHELDQERQRAQKQFAEELEAERANAARLAAERLEAERQSFDKALEERLDAVERDRDAEEAARRAAEAEVAGRLQAQFAGERLLLQREYEERFAREREALAREHEARVATERETAARAAEERFAADRAAITHEHEERIATAREDAVRAAEARVAAERETIRETITRENEDRFAAEREALQRVFEERMIAEREQLAADHAAALKAAEERFSAERETLRNELEAHFASERAALEQEFDERVASERNAFERKLEDRLSNTNPVISAPDQVAIAVREAEHRFAAERAAMKREFEEELRMAMAAGEGMGEEIERQVQTRLEEERNSLQQAYEQQRENDRLEIQRAAEERFASVERELRTKLDQERAAIAAAAAEVRRSEPKPPPVVAREEPRGFLGRLFGRGEPGKASNVNLNTKRVAGNDTASRRRASAMPSPVAKRKSDARKPRILLLEKRRGTADTIAPRLREHGVELEIVERWIDAVDELFRFRPNALFVDTELPDFEKIYKSISEQTSNMPIFLTGKAGQPKPAVRHAGYVSRPYDLDELLAVAFQAATDSTQYLAQQQLPPRQEVAPKAAPAPLPVREVPRPRNEPLPRAARTEVPVQAQAAAGEGTTEISTMPITMPMPLPRDVARSDDSYEVTCYNCRVSFEAIDADWCSCLAKERSLVCTNCLTCFCKAPPAYKEKFWMDAPPRLFERKNAELRRRPATTGNPAPDQVAHPLVLLVEDDEDVQVIVQRVCNNLGYGFVSANNGQDGLEAARGYRPDLILSDAFMPKLDGREMCRMLKEDPEFADTKMVVMTGLYTDTKYKSEALKRFHIDDYLSKPVAITDLINLLQRHLDGVAGLPMQEDLHELHRRNTMEQELPDDVLPADMLEEIADEPPARRDGYEICCFTCGQMFDAAKAEWCTCLGRDQTLACTNCGNCFCKAPSLYRERFWVDAPAALFERKMIGSKRNVAGRGNPLPSDVRRPLILLVEDDENIQLIVKTVVTTLGFGFIVGANGQEGLALAREYSPDLILSDAFMPKLDGREMCRLLKEDPSTARAKAIIMTGLYTDRKYRSEALDYFKVDDYVAKPLAVDDLIRLMKKHLPQDIQPTM